LNEYDYLKNYFNAGGLNVGKPGLFDRALYGRTTEGTLGRFSSTVANRARRRDWLAGS